MRRSAEVEDGGITGQITRREALPRIAALPFALSSAAREFLIRLGQAALGAAVLGVEESLEARRRPDMAVILDEVQTAESGPKYLDTRYVQAILGNEYEYLGQSEKGYRFRISGNEVEMTAEDVQALAKNPLYEINIPGGRTVRIEIDLHDFARQLPKFAQRFWQQRQGITLKTEGIVVAGPGEMGEKEKRVMDISKFLNPTDPLIRKLAARITREIDDPIEKLRALLIFVQQFESSDDVADVEGTNRFDRPTFPLATLLLRTGECEDKVALLASLALAVPEVANLGLELVYAWYPVTQRWHSMMGVRRGVPEIKFRDFGAPQKTAGVYAIDVMMKIPGLIGYLQAGMSASDIKNRTRLS